MENTPKSKAFIITFILILILLIAGYFVYKSRDQLFGTKGSLTTSKIFSPLLGSSKNKNLNVINETGSGANTKTDPNNPNGNDGNIITGWKVTSDQYGNQIILAEAGENLKKGDVLYASGANANKDPIVMKAIANDKNKSIVFGVAAENIEKGKMGKIIIRGILTGIPTNRKEITNWAVNNVLYLSDTIYGGMTKNSPLAPSLTVLVGGVLKVDAINGSIRIGLGNNGMPLFNPITLPSNLGANRSKNSGNYFPDSFVYDGNCIDGIKNGNETKPDIGGRCGPNGPYGAGGPLGQNTNGNCIDGIKNGNETSADIGGRCGPNGPYGPGGPFGPFGPGGPVFNTVCMNGADNPDLCTTAGGKCLNKGINPPTCTISQNGKCINGADNPELCTTIGGKCLNKATNPPLCNKIIKCENKATNPPLCTTIDKCTNGADNPKLCTTKGNKCLNNATNPPLCDKVGGPEIGEEVTDGLLACQDKVDNDLDGKIDSKDPNCHMDGDLTQEYLPTNNSEAQSPVLPYTNSCLKIDMNPLEFTDDERAELDELLRKFYLIAPNLKSEDDIDIAYSEILQYQNFSEHLSTLINQCYTQTNDQIGYAEFCRINPKSCSNSDKFSTTYDGPKTKWGNPWYKYSTLRGSYITGNNFSTRGSNVAGINGKSGEIFDCKYVSGWFSGTGADGKDCNTFNQQLYAIAPASCAAPINLIDLSTYNGSTQNRVASQRDTRSRQDIVYTAALKNRCVWNPGAYIYDMEKISNVW